MAIPDVVFMKPNIHKIKKIVIGKSDEVAPVVEKIIDADAKEIVLSIPRFSRLGESLANFHLIKRESDLLKKKVIVESVDDKAVELASVAGLDALNPILSRSRRQFSDIIPTRYTKEVAAEREVNTRKLAESVKQSPASRFDAARKKIKGKTRRFVVVAGVAAGFLLLAFVANATLPKADIGIVRKKSDWAYKDSVKASKLGSVDAATATVPAQVFTAKKSLQLSFPASGKKFVERKAGGSMTIYNAYSSDPQPLVATTRFLAPDGKIFRLSKGITVPGAKIVEGKIIPSSLDAAVIADQAGADYNIGPVNYFSIPGFKGSPKYQAFYGESKKPMTGGFIGEVAFPTDQDVKKAKTEIAKKIEEEIKKELAGQIPGDFKTIDRASEFVLLDQKVITEVDSSSNFSVLAEASLTVVVFKEAEVISMLAEKMRRELGDDYEFKTADISYGQARSDFKAGKISFPVDAKTQVAKQVDIEDLKTKVKGKSEAELKTLIYALPDLQSATIKLWPFWVTRVPSEESRILIEVN